MKAIVITTINGLTPAIQKFVEYTKSTDWQIIIVGDNKTPHIESFGNLTFLSIQDQEKLGYPILENIPHNCYARKNIGYLYAMKNGADVIYETDDDNYPYPKWCIPTNFNESIKAINSDFVNICSLYIPPAFSSQGKIWPRGYPLELINTDADLCISPTELCPSIIQTLADDDPDVDAVYRLTNNRIIKFSKNKSFVIEPDTFVPFNSQSTFWNKEVFSFMYFPISVSWRFADILRSYIAQKLLWDKGLVLGYFSPIVYQDRNQHDYMEDFRQEFSMYNSVMPVVNLLKSLDKTSIQDIYTQLYKSGIVKQEDVEALSFWLKSFE